MAANGIFLSGNLVKDPELQATKSGKFVTSFRIAVDEAGTTHKDSGFFTCQAWGQLAENLAETLHRGERVIVVGTLRHRTYEVEGKQRSATEVLVNDAGPSMLWATAAITKRVQQEHSSEPVDPVPAA
ncbi:MAG: single-stranded DNA-binding protein [Actinomycetota bacterium]|nr:single-stranded DNA-binding protein [Actinomycetota bacterium]